MPYRIDGPNGEGKFEVKNENGEIKAKHATKEDAEKQVRLLHMLEKERG
jgi:hypothetical protein